MSTEFDSEITAVLGKSGFRDTAGGNLGLLTEVQIKRRNEWLEFTQETVHTQCEPAVHQGQRCYPEVWREDCQTKQKGRLHEEVDRLLGLHTGRLLQGNSSMPAAWSYKELSSHRVRTLRYKASDKT